MLGIEHHEFQIFLEGDDTLLLGGNFLKLELLQFARLGDVVLGELGYLLKVVDSKEIRSV